MATSQAVIAALDVSAVTWNQPAPGILGAGPGGGPALARASPVGLTASTPVA